MCGDSEDVLDESYWDEYESGPFCGHWQDPCDCDELCKCGHQCNQHYDDGCRVDGCECEGFEDKET
jgi:hypothetical protein